MRSGDALRSEGSYASGSTASVTPPRAAALSAADVYRWLMSGPRGICDMFDAHVLASVLSLAVHEATRLGGSLVDSLGLSPPVLSELVGSVFSHALPLFSGLDPALTPAPSEDEACLADLLRRMTTRGDGFEQTLAVIVARRCLCPHHLWQDLGLRSRNELSWLMERHFEPLAVRNARDMKWKKFLYRTICRDEGYSLCTAPSCAECDDLTVCFGDESGESLLAHARNAAEQATR